MQILSKQLFLFGSNLNKHFFTCTFPITFVTHQLFINLDPFGVILFFNVWVSFDP